MSHGERRTQNSGPLEMTEIPSPRRVALFVKHWWFAISVLITVAFTLYGTVQTVKAHELRLARLETMMIGVAINGAIACGDQPGCVSIEAMMSGQVPQQAPQFRLTMEKK